MKRKVVCFVLALAMASVAQAAPLHMVWDGAGGNDDWNNAANWWNHNNPPDRHVPGTNDVAYADGQTVPVVAGPATGDVGNIWVGQYTPVEPINAGCVMNGVNITVTGEFSGQPNRGAVGMGHADGNYTLDINDSTLNVGGGPGSNDIVVGSHWTGGGAWASETSTSVMTIDNSIINNAGHNSLIGGAAYGTLNLNNGTMYDASGAGVTWVGFYGYGVLNVNNSTMDVGILSIADQLNPGNAPTAGSNVTVTNNGVINAASEYILIGTRDHGVLNVSDGGIFQATTTGDINLGFLVEVDKAEGHGEVNVYDGGIFRSSISHDNSEIIIGSGGTGEINVYGGHVYSRAMPVFGAGSMLNLLDYDGALRIWDVGVPGGDTAAKIATMEGLITGGNILGIGGDQTLANFDIRLDPAGTEGYDVPQIVVQYVPEPSSVMLLALGALPLLLALGARPLLRRRRRG